MCFPMIYFLFNEHLKDLFRTIYISLGDLLSQQSSVGFWKLFFRSHYFLFGLLKTVFGTASSQSYAQGEW